MHRYFKKRIDKTIAENTVYNVLSFNSVYLWNSASLNKFPIHKDGKWRLFLKSLKETYGKYVLAAIAELIKKASSCYGKQIEIPPEIRKNFVSEVLENFNQCYNANSPIVKNLKRNSNAVITLELSVIIDKDADNQTGLLRAKFCLTEIIVPKIKTELPKHVDIIVEKEFQLVNNNNIAAI